MYGDWVEMVIFALSFLASLMLKAHVKHENQEKNDYL